MGLLPLRENRKSGGGVRSEGVVGTTGQENSVLDRKADYLMALPSPSSRGTSGGWRSEIFPMEGPAAPLNRSHSSPCSEVRRRQIMRSGVQGQSHSAKREISFFQLNHSGLKEQFLSSEKEEWPVIP